MNKNMIQGKKYTLADMKMVRVDWLDAMSDDNTWQELDELSKQTLKPVTCVGWILAENKDNIILVSSFDEDAQMGGGGCTIPKSCVKKIIHLREMSVREELWKEELKNIK